MMDYYNILGVNKSASQQEIKSAYKKLAMQHHPDRGGDNHTFSQINTAYDTLKDTNKRFMYDHQQNAPKQTFNQHTGRRTRFTNENILISVKITLEDVLFGKEILGTYTLSNGLPQTASIKIPPGINNGDTLRFAGLGDNNNPSIPRGDLYVNIIVLKDKMFTRDNNHLKCTAKCSILELMTGTSLKIKTLQGNVEIKIPPGTNPDTTFSVAGYGLPEINKRKVGNLYVTVKGITPKINDAEILYKVKQLNDEISSSPRCTT